MLGGLESLVSCPSRLAKERPSSNVSRDSRAVAKSAELCECLLARHIERELPNAHKQMQNLCTNAIT